MPGPEISWGSLCQIVKLCRSYRLFGFTGLLLKKKMAFRRFPQITFESGLGLRLHSLILGLEITVIRNGLNTAKSAERAESTSRIRPRRTTWKGAGIQRTFSRSPPQYTNRKAKSPAI